MQHYKILKHLLTLLAVCIFFSCNNSAKPDDNETEPRTPVSVSSISILPLEENIELYATSVFQTKDNVKSNMSGYVDAHVKLGEYVKKAQLLFTVKTKEATALESDSVNKKFGFSGVSNVYSPIDGVITELERQTGDYVQEGDAMAVVAKQSSLVFQLEVPYEMKKYVRTGTACSIELSNDENIKGVVSSEMPVVDAASQTQSYIVQPYSSSAIPENLIAKVKILKSIKNNAQTLPKTAVLTDETQSEWWVMKLINDSTAVKVPVEKGIESDGKVEILSPVFETSDRIIIKGNYGLSDTAKVSVVTAKD